ncbi:MAG: TonB-dependent receptor [Bryobacterales bacterium]|nr:TonB-dependent receptor [Bryobacterales bacterium]
MIHPSVFHFRTFALFAMVLLAASPASAQSLYGGLVGTVTDKSGAVVPGAPVTLTNPQTQTVRQAVTGGTGNYAFATLPPGTYSVTVKATGFRSVTFDAIPVGADKTVRVDASLDVGDVVDEVTVSASTIALQTDGAEVRRELNRATLDRSPIPLGRNYQSLLITLPGVSPPQTSNSFPANPSRGLAFSVNGASSATNNIRIDGASSYNPNLPAVTAINPSLESIEAVDVVTNSFSGEHGLAGGAAINLQIRSGTNQLHGSGFWYHNHEALGARPYFGDRAGEKPKFRSNQMGGTLGGPIRKNRIFYFLSYERTTEDSSPQRFLTVPTAAMRRGDLNGSPSAIYDPLTGAGFDPARPTQFAADRQPFANKQIPLSRFSEPVRKILAMPDWPLPNAAGTGSLGITRNYLAKADYQTKRDQIDTKVNYTLTDKWTAFHRLSALWIDQVNPAAFGALAGPQVHPTNNRPGFGFGEVWTSTASSTYVFSRNTILDGHFGYTLRDHNAGPSNLNENFARDTLGIPGTNGPTSFSGGMARFLIDGFDQLGYIQVSPSIFHDKIYQTAVNLSHSLGRHELRMGFEFMRWSLNQETANVGGAFGGPAGGFRFRADTTTLRGGPAANDYNAIASLLLGLAREAGRTALSIPSLNTRNNQYSLYVRDRWQISPRLTVSYGLRWEYFPYPTRSDRGLERYDFRTNEILVCGVGAIPVNCGAGQSKRQFAPRIGIAYRPSSTMVARVGYGLTYDPATFGRNLRGNFPVTFAQELAFQDARSWSTTLTQGLPAPATSPLVERIPAPATVAVITVDDNYRRGYIQSWNATIEKQLRNWLVSTGYVATRSIRAMSFLEANWANLGEGNAGRQLVRQFNRTAATTFAGHVGVQEYDGLQTSIRYRASSMTIGFAHTWAHTRGHLSADGDAPRIAIPQFRPRTYGPTPEDRRHNFTVNGSFELPFGRGKRWANSGFASALAGGWNVNLLTAMYTGAPVTPTANATVLNAPGSGNYADCFSAPVKIGTPNLWWDPATFADPNRVDPRTPRFGTCGEGVLRAPGIINADAGVFRKIRVTESIDLQIRGEAFNVSNTPHFAAPAANISNSNFGVITGIQNTGRDGIDSRIFRLGIRVGW